VTTPGGAESRVAADPVAVIDPPPEPEASRRRWRSAAIDPGVLRRSRDFRLLFAGQAVSFTGSMITYVAIPFQVYALTKSSWLVGLLGVTEIVPLIVTGLLGGVIADAFDRRRTVLLTEMSLVVLTALLVLNSVRTQPAVWPLFAVSAAFAAVDGVQRPSLEALLPRVVERDDLPAAIALASLRMNVGLVAGPPLAGVVIASFGTTAAYVVDAATFAASLTALTLMRATPPAPDAPPVNLRSVADGWRYARSRPELLGTYLVDINAMLFGMPNALFPAIASHIGGASALGVLYAAPSVGSLLVTVTSGWTAGVRRHGLAILLAATAWGLAIIGFGAAGSIWIAVPMLVLAGGADMVSGLFRMRMWNETIPDHLRGRLAGIELLSYSSGPLLGNAEAGGVAAATSVRFSVMSGGILCVVGCLVCALTLPKFVSYVAEPAVRG
jgi:MFS family permease